MKEVVVVLGCIASILVAMFVFAHIVSGALGSKDRYDHIYEQVEHDNPLAPGMHRMSCGCLLEVSQSGSVYIRRHHDQKEGL